MHNNEANLCKDHKYIYIYMDIETKSNLCRNDIDYKRQHHLLLNRLYCRKKQFEIGVQKKKSSSLRFNIYIYIYIYIFGKKI